MKPIRSLGVLAFALAAGAPAAAQAPATTPPGNWWLLDAQADRWRGTSTERAYRELLAGKQPRRQVVVAIIDSGVDIEHEDLDGVLWTNPREVAGNGRDDDNNGYVDDIHGWNFLGGRDGRNVEQDTYEMVRLYGRLHPLYANARQDTLNAAAKAEYALYQEVKAAYEPTVAELRQNVEQTRQIAAVVDQAVTILRGQVGADSLTTERIRAVQSADQRVMQARAILLELAENDYTPAMVRAEVADLEKDLATKYNPAFNPRTIVGDNPANLNERGYGNPGVEGPEASHGTHVAGIVAAERGNGRGIDGIATGARLMILRTVPDGDERDKDVANAIRYAVDNGAHVVNMSFGKGFSPQKSLVDEAVRYADSKGVLLVHASGNDGANLDTGRNFPNQFFANGSGRARLWIEVGASHWGGQDSLAAYFSNYSKEKVDIFAPGTAIHSTIPGSQYANNQGTSMAAPVVTGVAALLMAYYPELTAEQVRQIILESATRYPGQEVALPGGKDAGRGRFENLSATGGIVNTYNALRMAEQRAGARR